MNMDLIPEEISEAKDRLVGDLKRQNLNLFNQNFGDSILLFEELQRNVRNEMVSDKQVDRNLEADIMRQLRDQGVVSG
ncbi:MAG: hypothetical protein ABI876_01135 [Bacteroidota bacterium]